jgi:hypothetical protein
MKIPAITKVKNYSDKISVVEVYNPRYPVPLLTLDSRYHDKSVELITGWDDLTDITPPLVVNGGIIQDHIIKAFPLVRGMWIEHAGTTVVYVVTNERLI